MPSSAVDSRAPAQAERAQLVLAWGSTYCRPRCDQRHSSPSLSPTRTILPLASPPPRPILNLFSSSPHSLWPLLLLAPRSLRSIHHGFVSRPPRSRCCSRVAATVFAFLRVVESGSDSDPARSVLPPSIPLCNPTFISISLASDCASRYPPMSN